MEPFRDFLLLCKVTLSNNVLTVETHLTIRCMCSFYHLSDMETITPGWIFDHFDEVTLLASFRRVPLDGPDD